MAKYAQTITMAIGDLRPKVAGFCQEEHTGNIVDLSTASSAKFFMYPMNDDGTLGVVKINGAVATIVSGTGGELNYTFTGTDTDTVGRFIAYFVIYWGAASTLPETTSIIEVNIKNPRERRGY